MTRSHPSLQRWAVFAVAAMLSLPAQAVRAGERDAEETRCRDAGPGLRALHQDDDCRVVLTFVTVGDSREEAGASYLTAQDAIWLQNTRVWSRIMREAQAHRPELLFFNGDMIMGYKDAAVPANHEGMNRQYAFWRGMVTQLLEGGTYVVPVPGNHETQDKAAGKKSKFANEVLWRDNMADLVLDAGRFASILGAPPARFDPANNPFARTAAADGITTDQTQLTYSFDVGATHFAVVNTDPVGNDAHAPAAWLAADFAAARATGATRFFVFGHKPAFSYYYALASGGPSTKANGLDAVSDLTGRDAFWKVIEDYGAAYFCGHEHIYNASRPLGGAWQVIVGSGGSPFESDAVLPMDRTYAYAVVNVYANGEARVITYGFPEGQGPTHRIASWRLH